MIKLFERKSGFTLVEVLTAVSLFASVGFMALIIFTNIARIQAQLALENAIYEDARFMMERISRSVRINTIDYEEYFNKNSDANNKYGDSFGCYAAQFYNPGKGDWQTPDISTITGEMGAICNDGTLYTGQECVVYKPSVDLNTGMYPYLGAPADTIHGTTPSSNAFCPKYPNYTDCTAAAPDTENRTDQLYLIDREGKNKLIYALKEFVDDSNTETALAMIRLKGEDVNNDGITEKWSDCAGGTGFCCAEGFDCDLSTPPGLVKLEETLTTAADFYQGFVPISPSRTTVKRLDFYISPGEDPRKAFAEENEVLQPRVRIVLEVEPTKAALDNIGIPEEQAPKIILQTTISTRLQSEVKSYLGPDTHDVAACNLSSD